MALTITNNVLAGVLAPELSSLISIGSKDYSLWNIATSTNKKARLAYTTASSTPEDITTAGLCGLTGGGDSSLIFMNLDFVTLGDQQFYCVSDFYGTDYAQAGNGYQNQTINEDLLNSFASQFAASFGLFMENLRWSGDDSLAAPSPLRYHDGFVVRLLALGAYSAGVNDDGYQQVTSTPVTASNVVDEINKVVAKLPFEVTSHPDFKIVVGPLVASAFRTAAMAGTGVNNVNMTNFDATTGRITDNFFGFPIYQARGLGATAQNTNLIIGGIFGDSPEGVAKWGVNTPNEAEDIQLKLVEDGDKFRLRITMSQNVAVIPDGSQIAMNL